MILGLGVDIVAVDRIQRAMRRHGFLQRVLTPEERSYASGPAWVAGRWAAKEAVAKAVGLSLTWQDVEIFNGPSGRPSAVVRGLPRGTVHVSLSHERGNAVAVAIWEGES